MVVVVKLDSHVRSMIRSTMISLGMLLVGVSTPKLGNLIRSIIISFGHGT